jgi:hypothetical protein
VNDMLYLSLDVLSVVHANWGGRIAPGGFSAARPVR